VTSSWSLFIQINVFLKYIKKDKKNFGMLFSLVFLIAWCWDICEIPAKHETI